MSILRAKTLDLRQTRELSARQKDNSRLNEQEALAGAVELYSYPRRLVFEMTNACNLNCRMCARNAADFKPTLFNPAWHEFFDPIISHVEEVTLMGWGEPTVHPDFGGFLRWAKQRGLRKYFCTNGMRLNKIIKDVFETETDIIAISLDGATPESNARIRRGADFHKIIQGIQAIVAEKQRVGTVWPYMNFVFTAMKSNIREFPAVVRLAGQLGLEEVKLVYLTVFEPSMAEESLFNEQALVGDVFNQAMEEAASHGVDLKLPHLQGQDPAGLAAHKPCYTAWRDFFLGSDGYIRPCMSTAAQFAHISDLKDFSTAWNSEPFVRHRQQVNGQAYDRCARCYQSSYANWNRPEAFLQTGHAFAPEWQAK